MYIYPMYVVCIRNKKSLKKRLLILYGGLLQKVDYNQIILITVVGIATIYYIQNAEKSTKKALNKSRI
ncbi:hypothetical protein COI67_16425 [Bacillus cereus]|nr:hypothetical protein CN515_21970 [Bacillus cereus]PFD44017.1 hypothetical protein CN293_27950 [Bacillus cereus]PFI12872.1 hypothetical protein COI67_16425 [Bacillus cereus]PFJ18671.1 hypothetical protein COI91_21270 [Bacillus cereus]PGM25986.1 hypothetical protein CN940_03540 [Bacillus cereus]